jgi:uncharacterized protein
VEAKEWRVTARGRVNGFWVLKEKGVRNEAKRASLTVFDCSEEYYMKRLFLIVLGWLVLSFTAHAASFDCAKAVSKVEKLICADSELSKLDEELAAAYKTALQDEKQADSIRQMQKQWIKERNGCIDAVCVKRTYEERLLSLHSVASIPMTSSVDANNTGQVRGAASAILLTACNAEDMRDKLNIRIQDITGLYRQSVDGLPAYVGRSEEKRRGYNYLAITPLAGNRVRIRLSTREINGHDCGFDSEAVLCGRIIRLIPSDEEKSTLDIRKLPIPNLRVTANQIAFIPDANGSYVWGSPYCGAMGYLRQIFSRATRKMKFDDAIFDQ